MTNVKPGPFLGGEKQALQAHQGAVVVLTRAQVGSSSHAEELPTSTEGLFLAPPAFFTDVVHNPRSRLTCLRCASVQVAERG